MKHIQFDDEIINRLAKSITGYCFRNGPVENFHADRCLTNAQMNELCTFMVDRIGYCIKLISDQNFDDLDILLGFHYITCRKWNDIDFSVGESELAELRRIYADRAKRAEN